ncbi:hypothetical protein [Desulfovibrio sp. JC022]|uniref:hypothetical protein n=1 Tax=Desulfovibrio sp. JC022 TaxID=2593642 RepID=UPI0013D73EDD|nr:hypothetical protein [Desulfovibrio sp. JC022]NDV23614.1 hypothetical protein [Desulfovibrio sp. JC022]
MQIPFSAQYTLDEISEALGCDEAKFKKEKTGSLQRSNGIYELERWNGVLHFNRKTPFSTKETEFIKKILASYNSLSKQLSTRGVAHQYMQTAITSSVLDISIARYISSSPDSFLYIHKLIQHLKRLSLKQYEGSQIRTGFLITETKHQKQKEFDIDSVDYEIVPTDGNIKLDRKTIKDTTFLRIIDGINSFYLCDPKLDISAYCNILSSEYDSFEKLSGKCIENILRSDTGAQFYAGVSNSAEFEIITHDNIRILHRKGRWYFIDCNLVNGIIASKHRETEPWRIFYAMSKIKKGTVALITDKTQNSLEKLVKRHVSDDSGVRKNIDACIKDADLGRLCETGELMRILTTDGMSIFDKHFDSLIDYSAIVNTALCDSDTGGGGRESAAIAGSLFGTTVKVSEDGPITIFKDKKIIYDVG